MKVYVVFLYAYEDTRILGVFKHHGDAEEFVKTLSKDDAYNSHIYEWEVK